MSWLSVFLKSSVSKALWSLSVKIFTLKLGEIGKKMVESAKKAAIEAELSGKSGYTKKEMVMKALKEEFGNSRQGMLETAVQIAWMWVDQFLKENEGNISKLKQL